MSHKTDGSRDTGPVARRSRTLRGGPVPKSALSAANRLRIVLGQIGIRWYNVFMFIVSITRPRDDRQHFLGGVQEGDVVDLRPVRSVRDAYRFPSRREANRAALQVLETLGLPELTYEVVEP